MKRIAAAMLHLAHIHVVYGQTLYTVSVANPSFTNVVEGSIFVSAVGVGADGWTTYTESGTISLEALEGPSTTTTLFSTPARLEGKFEESASGYRFSLFGGDFAETCAFGPNGRGTCVERKVVASSTIFDITFSGSVVPFYTISAFKCTINIDYASPSADLRRLARHRQHPHRPPQQSTGQSLACCMHSGILRGGHDSSHPL
ncbi:hypothetical protein B0H14DRAFT_2887072, partial [Mycena olivaceomarginata]